MGIKGLTKLIDDTAPDAMKERKKTEFIGRTVALDASMCIYQFLVAVRSSDNGGAMSQLTNEAGEVTSHLTGMFYRTIRLFEVGIKPVFVFDGAAPTMKGGELAKRKAKRKDAESKHAEATEAGNTEQMDKFSKRTVRMTKQHSVDCMKLLRLMGCPVIEAPGEAEAQCADMCTKGKVWAMASEDMDSLTFGAPIMLRRLTMPDARKLPVLEIHLDKVLAGMGLSMDQFIDVCIMSGCDYCDTFRGIGPKKALAGVKKWNTLERFIKSLDKSKYKAPASVGGTVDGFIEELQKVRKLFKTPVVADSSQMSLKFTEPDEAGILKYLAEEKGFSEDRVKSGLARLKKAKKKSGQKRIDSFFSFKPAPASNLKRKGGKGKAKGKGKGKGSKKQRKR